MLATGIKDARLLHRGGEIAVAAGQTARGQQLIAQALRLNPRFDPTLTGAAQLAEVNDGQRL